MKFCITNIKKILVVMVFTSLGLFATTSFCSEGKKPTPKKSAPKSLKKKTPKTPASAAPTNPNALLNARMKAKIKAEIMAEIRAEIAANRGPQLDPHRVIDKNN